MTKITGKLIFDPKGLVVKHKNQPTWKKTAIIVFEGELDAMWSWFLSKRFGLTTQRSVRGCHTTIVNEKINSNKNWNRLKKLHHNKEFTIELTKKVGSNTTHWWLEVVWCEELKDIREELGLERIGFNVPHITVGLVNEKNIQHSDYIKKLVRSGY